MSIVRRAAARAVPCGPGDLHLRRQLYMPLKPLQDQGTRIER
jgi:hypothetical protein